MSDYPSSITSLTNPAATDKTDSPSHASQHSNANNEIMAVESELGVNPSGSSATVVARLDTNDATVSSNTSDISTNTTAIGLNTTHKSSNGTDHSYIDQDITVGAAPEFACTNFTDATSTTVGVVELATTAEVNTGTDAARAITPDALAGSNAATRVVVIKVVDDATELTTGDGKVHFFVPSELNGMNLVGVSAGVSTASSSGTPEVQIYNVTDSTDMLSTTLTIDANEKHSKDAAAAAVIDTGEDDVVTGDELRVDVDTAGTGTKGLQVDLKFRTP